MDVLKIVLLDLLNHNKELVNNVIGTMISIVPNVMLKNVQLVLKEF